MRAFTGGAVRDPGKSKVLGMALECFSCVPAWVLVSPPRSGVSTKKQLLSMESAILVLRHEVIVLPLRMQVEGSPDKASAVTALGTLQNLAAESAANKDAIREAGGIPVLINILETAPDTPVRYFLPFSTIPPCIISCNTLRGFTCKVRKLLASVPFCVSHSCKVSSWENYRDVWHVSALKSMRWLLHRFLQLPLIRFYWEFHPLQY